MLLSRPSSRWLCRGLAWQYLQWVNQANIATIMVAKVLYIHLKSVLNKNNIFYNKTKGLIIVSTSIFFLFSNNVRLQPKVFTDILCDKPNYSST